MSRGRVLTLERIRHAGACGGGREVFRETWGARATVNQAWAQQAAAKMGTDDAHWAMRELLPAEWWIISNKARREACYPCSHIGRAGTREARVAWAVFAALYLEAGKE